MLRVSASEIPIIDPSEVEKLSLGTYGMPRFAGRTSAQIWFTNAFLPVSACTSGWIYKSNVSRKVSIVRVVKEKSLTTQANNSWDKFCQQFSWDVLTLQPPTGFTKLCFKTWPRRMRSKDRLRPRSSFRHLRKVNTNASLQYRKMQEPELITTHPFETWYPWCILML